MMGEKSTWADSVPAPVKIVLGVINTPSPHLPFSHGVPQSGWLIPKPTAQAWRGHAPTIRAWLHGLSVEQILRQPLAAQFLVIYSLVIVVTLGRLVKTDQAKLMLLMDAYTKALEGLK